MCMQCRLSSKNGDICHSRNEPDSFTVIPHLLLLRSVIMLTVSHVMVHFILFFHFIVNESDGPIVSLMNNKDKRAVLLKESGMDERTLIQLAKNGNTEALAELFRSHYSLLRGYLVNITMNPELAEDLVQDTMIKAMRKLHLYEQDKSKLSTWLITIASRLYMDHMRKMKRDRRLVETEAERVMRQLRWRANAANEEWHALLDVLATLDPDLRVPIMLKHYYGYSQEEIASMLDVPAGTIKSRIHNGISRIRKEWGNR